MRPIKEISIFEFTDYRLYLNEYYKNKKQQKNNFSYRQFAQKANLSSPSHLLMIMSGERNLSLKTMPKIIKCLKLNKLESNYFELLVSYNQATDFDQRSQFFSNIMQLRSKRTSLHSLEREKFEFLSKWYGAAIYALIDLKDFKSDIHWISKRLNGQVSPGQVKETMETLCRLNLITEDSERGFRQVPGAINVEDDTRSMAVFNYHKSMLQKADESLRTDPIEKREMNGVTISIPKSKLPEIKEMIRSFRKEINMVASSYLDPDEVYQLNLQFFPLSKLEEPK